MKGLNRHALGAVDFQVENVNGVSLLYAESERAEAWLDAAGLDAEEMSGAVLVEDASVMQRVAAAGFVVDAA
jgi:hypothetical protein